MEEMVILGSGPAGLTAAIYAARAELKPLVLAGHSPGGQLMLTGDVENFPGFPEGIKGPDLMMAMQKQAEKFGAVVKFETAKTITKKEDGTIEIVTEDRTLQTKTLIIATGASARWLGLESETKFKSRGIHTCATCDGYFYKEKEVIIVGGGDAACEEASYLSKIATKVTLLLRGEEFVASTIMQNRVKNNPKIEIMLNTSPIEFKGENMLSSVVLKNNKTGETQEKKIDGVFLAIGHIPNVEPFKDVIELTDRGIVKIDSRFRTNVKGIFAAGDIGDAYYKQAIIAAGAGSSAAIEAERYIHSLEDKE